MTRSLLTAAMAGALAALAPTVACADPGHAHFSAGVPGDPRKPARTIEIVMKEGDGKMEYVPSRIEAALNSKHGSGGKRVQLHSGTTARPGTMR